MRANTVSQLMIKAHTLLGVLILLPCSTLAQDDSAFLACEPLEVRSQRLACLEAALEAATNQQPTQQPNPPTSTPVLAPVPAQESAGRSAETRSAGEPVPESASSQEADDPSVATPSAAVEQFGLSEPRITENTAGNEELHDTIVSVEALRPNQWRIVLTSGQVWFQVHAKRFNLRAGDPVRIYPTNWGENYRLDSDKLNGFIQVQRLE